MLQKIIASQKNQHIASDVATSPESLLLVLTSKRRFVPVWTSLNRGFLGLVATIFCNHLAKLLQKIIASHKNQHIASHVATIFCNHLAKFPHPKRRFRKAEHTCQSAFSKHFSTFCSQNTVLTPFKSASKTHSEIFVRPSKIFVSGV
jgi:hypothetical protein